MQTESGIKVLDPEFCFYGDAAFDTGVMRAHLMMAKQPTEIIASIEKLYNPPAGYDQKRSLAYTGIEIIRRIIGLAQLPLSLTLNEKEVLLNKAMELLEIQ
jgi:5-methylthioribose kinase